MTTPEISAAFDTAFDSTLAAFQSFGASCEQASAAFAALGIAAQLIDVDIRATANARRQGLRKRLGWLCVLTPEWWTLRRIEHKGCM